MTLETESYVVDDLFSLAYEELRRLASRVRRRDVGATASSTGLVHEAWLRLRNSPLPGCQSAEHFKAIAARAMRQVLVDAARRRTADKRGGAEAILVPYEEILNHGRGSDEELLALDFALRDLDAQSPRLAQIVECHFFGGLTIAETALLLNLSESQIERDWRAAKAWLAINIRPRKV